ncbi:MAG: hypothetical protein KDD64_07995 [Bdellovibrionales bacterium]|nr:hypothetical protein [Bdellovibrionales bacterium]
MAVNGVNTGVFTDTFTKNYLGGIGKSTNTEKTAKRIGDGLDSAEQNYLAAIKSGDQGKIAEAEQDVKKWTRIMESFSRVNEYMHQIIMRLLQRLDAR